MLNACYFLISCLNCGKDYEKNSSKNSIVVVDDDENDDDNYENNICSYS